MTRVILTKDELRLATIVGAERYHESVTSGRSDNHGCSMVGGLEKHILGAAGEMALAKALDRFWSPTCCTFKNPDLGTAVQVRTRSQSHYDLIVRDDDADNHAFVLVLGNPPVFEIRGWIWGKDAKQPEWVRAYGDRPPAWFVPQESLKPLEEL